VNAEFNWWLLIAGLVAGAGLVWFVLMDMRRGEADVDEEERVREALWLSSALADEGFDVPPDAAERALTLHREYLEAPPPDEPIDPDDLEPDRLEVPAEPGRVGREAGRVGGEPRLGGSDGPLDSERAGDDGVAIGRRAAYHGE